MAGEIKNMKRILNTIFTLLVVALFPSILKAQDYFQQDVKYNIHVKLNDVKHELSAFESIEYTNNSPVELTFLYFHLWPNAYKNNSTALARQLLENGNTFFYYADDSLKGFIDSMDFKVNDKSVKWEFDGQNIDICKLMLNEPLKQGQTITITTPFHVKIPDSRISRLGHEGQSYQISQWYPKPAVYDINGWNAMPYLNQGEFYSEFGSFDVYITLPENYVVGATGDLVDGEKEVEWLEEKAWQTSQMKYFDSKNISFPASSKQTKTLHYHQENVHDFAWFADKRYHVLKGKVELPYTKRKVTTWVMFTNYDADLWKNGIEYVNDAVYYYSKWIGEYPYNQVTAVEGAVAAGGGMEYPNITVINSGGDSLMLEMVIMHEVGHNWFYGILGSNERKDPWMDEGINSFYDYRYLQTKYPGSTLFLGGLKKIIHTPSNLPLAERALIYQVLAHLNADQAAGLESEKYSLANYGGIVYEKTAVMLEYLFQYLGESRFDKAMQQYFEQWKFKHPQPKNLQNIMETATSEQLNWFFDDLINTNKKLDYKICSFKNGNATVKNKGQIETPFSLHIGDYETWYQGFKGRKTFSVAHIQLTDKTTIQITPNANALEYNSKNNSIKTKALFRKVKPLKIQMLPGIDDPDVSQICITPLFGFNRYNGFMPGLTAYNNPVPQKKFSYFIMPLYGTKNNSFAGTVKTGFTLLPKWNNIQLIWLGASYSHYAYCDKPFNLGYSRFIPELLIKIKNKNPRSAIFSDVRIRNFNICKDIVKYTLSSDNTGWLHLKGNSAYYVNQITFSLNNKRNINPYNINITGEQGDKFMKISSEAAYKITYNEHSKGLDIRAFFGGFIYKKFPIQEDFRFRISGQSGYGDYLLGHYFIGRSEDNGVLSQQFNETDGAFKINTPLGQTWEWIFAVNLKTSIPGKIPIKLFADIGTFPDKMRLSGSYMPVFYNGGIQLSIINNIFDIYFPVMMSKQIKDNNLLNNMKYLQTIRFTFSLEKIDPFKLLRDIR